MDISLILTRKYPDSEWYENGNDYSQLVWLSETPKPTKEELEALWPEVESEINKELVEKARADAYRETADPLFFQYQRGEATEQQWLDAVQAVKDAYPYEVA